VHQAVNLDQPDIGMLQAAELGPIDFPPAVFRRAPPGAQFLGDQLPAKEVVEVRNPRPGVLLDGQLAVVQLSGSAARPDVWADVASSSAGLAAAAS
jgi:hypothetical protein